MKKCVFAGTFDPPTLGHKSVIDSCLAVFDEVVVAFLKNPEKTPLFSRKEREEMFRLMYPETDRLKFVSFSGTAAELMKKENADVYVRGIRGGQDAEYENYNFYASRKLDQTLNVFYIPCPQELLHVSSTTVRTLLKFSKPLDGYVSEEVKAYISDILS
ncbi:MAG: pantetheine-phosphate adenylyltransferase [Clostridia bacterium]|nr:pantetheine-phosphate adenylyltransferase [Clostridia bacterium]